MQQSKQGKSGTNRVDMMWITDVVKGNREYNTTCT